MLKLGLKTFTCLVLCFSATLAQAYVINLGAAGEKLVWPASVTNITINVDSSNSSGLSSLDISQAVSSSVNSWNSVSEKQLSLNSGSGLQKGANDLVFSNNSLWFGGSAGVVGITLVSYDENSGKIVEADIILNDNYRFSNVTTDEFYVGNVVTHEMGHFLGISHSQLPSATMFYQLRRGQYSLDSDDKAAVAAINVSSKGKSITGTVIGGAKHIPVFGAHVTAISLKDGEIAAGTLSAQDGTFTINGLNSADSYYLYVEPAKNVSSLPVYYKDVKSNFCDSGTSYRGSFFQSCFSSTTGHPQLIQMDGNDKAIGHVTVRCGLDAAPAYLASKGGIFDFQIDNSQTGNLEATKAFVGFFSKSMIQSNQVDTIQLNLPDLQSYSQLQGKDIFLDVKFISQDLYSMFQYNVAATGDTSALSLPSDDVANFDGANIPHLDAHLQFPLLAAGGSTTHSIELSPKLMDDFLMATVVHSGAYPYLPTTADYFPAHDKGYGDDLFFYLAIASLKERQIDGSFTPVALPSNKNVYDNYACPDASRTYSVSGSVTKVSSAGPSFKKKNNDSMPITCGSVDFTGGNGGGGENPPYGLLALLAAAVLVTTRFREAL